MLIDEAIITIRGGNGGNGSSSLKRNAQTAKGGPDGGNGGNGGNVYIQGTNDITALSSFRYKKSVTAEDGVKGGRQNLYGRNGKDTIILVPFGTKITNLDTKKEFDVTEALEKFVIAKGGKGGRGNNEFKSATNQTPTYAEKGEKGETKRLLLELKLIADIGFIGLPNSGKSSLLSVLTNAHPKIGNYSFTTLEPNLGVMEGLIIADIPGLIEGASEGKGLGIKFLKHIERTKILLHCIDVQSENIVKDYETVTNELSKYSELLKNKKVIIALTKADLVDKEALKTKLKEVEKLCNIVISVSIYDDQSLDLLKKEIQKLSKAS